MIYVLESNQNHATIRADGICPTLPASMGMGGGYVPMITDAIPIEGNGTRQSHKGIGFSEDDRMYTLNTTEVHAVAFRKTAHPRNANEAQGYTETTTADTLNVFDNTEARTPILIVSPNGYITNSSGNDIAGTLDSYYYLGCGARGGA